LLLDVFAVVAARELRSPASRRVRHVAVAEVEPLGFESLACDVRSAAVGRAPAG
jgi:hypothetical protein